MTGLALAAGVVLAVAYTASPLLVVFAICLVPLFAWAGAGLEHRERRWLFAVLLAGILIRVAAIGALVLLADDLHAFNVFFPDARFAIERSWWIRNQWLGVEIGPVYRLAIYNPYGATSYSYVLAAIQLVVGQAPYGVNLVSVLAFVVAAVTLYRQARRSYSPTIAFGGITLLLFWPTMIGWSVSALRESMQLALTALVLVFSVRSVRARTWMPRLGMAAVAVTALAAISTLRSSAIIIVAGGVVLGLIARLMTLRPWLARASGVAIVVLTAILLSRPGVQERLLGISRDAVMRHVGNVATTGNGYKLLDYRFYVVHIDKVISTLTPPEAVDFLVRAAAAFFLVPLPWQMTSTASLAFLPQQIGWYLVILLCVPGIVAGVRRDPLFTWLLVAYIAAAVIVIAPNSGNIGTLVRHRDVVVLALVWLSSAGVCSMLARPARDEAPVLRLHGDPTGRVVM